MTISLNAAFAAPLAHSDPIAGPEKWDVSEVGTGFWDSNASSGRIVLLLRACWASKMSKLGTSLALCILHCFKAHEVCFHNVRVACPCFRPAHCLVVQSLQILTPQVTSVSILRLKNPI